MVFDKEWFEKNQKILLFLLNFFLTKRWFRWILRITKQDIGYTEKIYHIYPHAYSVILKDKIFFEFRTHNKYAKRLYYSFYYLWIFFHGIDIIFNSFRLPFSFGFDTFTFTPQGATTTDGTARYQSSELTYASIVAASGTSAQNSNAEDSICTLGTNGTTNLFNLLIRGIYTFDTTILINYGGTIAATFSVMIDSNSIRFGGTSFNVVSAFPASNTNIVASDYSNLGSVAFSTIAQASINSSGTAYTDWVLNTAGINNIFEGGITGFGVRDTWDITANFTGTWSGSTANDLRGFFADQSGTTQDPKLTVVTALMPVTIPGANIFIQRNTVGY